MTSTASFCMEIPPLCIKWSTNEKPTALDGPNVFTLHRGQTNVSSTETLFFLSTGAPLNSPVQLHRLDIVANRNAKGRDARSSMDIRYYPQENGRSNLGDAAHADESGHEGSAADK
jgi:hypothetical protein